MLLVYCINYCDGCSVSKPTSSQIQMRQYKWLVCHFVVVIFLKVFSYFSVSFSNCSLGAQSGKPQIYITQNILSRAHNVPFLRLKLCSNKH